MDSDTRPYIAVLTPKGTSPTDAQETRTITLDLDPTADESAHYTAVCTHIRTEQPIDPWAFDRHWEIATIRSAADDTPLRRALISRDATPTSHGYIPIQLYLQRPTGYWTETTFHLPDDLAADLKRWRQRLALDHPPVMGVPVKYIHEAMVRTVAHHDPALPSKVTDTPTFHAMVIRTAMKHPDTVVDKLDDINP